MSLYISSAMASSELRESSIANAISQLAVSVALAKQQGSIPEGPSLDITFMLPGLFDKPEFTGMRMGGYSDESATLYFEHSVPDYVIHSDKAQTYVAIVMQDVISNASEFFQENGIGFATVQWQQVAQLLVKVDLPFLQ